MRSVKIIAEAGVNHNGNKELAIDLIDSAKESGADYVKFQTFCSKEMTTSFAEQATYQFKNTNVKESQMRMLEKLELSFEEFEHLYDYSKSIKIGFLSTAFDFISLNFLVNSLKLNTLKIASGEITNAPFVLEHARTKKNIIMSTGMASMGEVILALGVIAFGMNASKNETPKKNSFIKAFESKAGQESLTEKVTLMHCITDYPAPHYDLNLNVIKKLKKDFKMKIGYSDHSDDIIIPSLAIACGAEVIEKHLTISKKMTGPDHKASLEPEDFKMMVNHIRKTEKILGKPEKILTQAEKENKKVSRKSLFAAKTIKKGEKFTRKNISIKRPEQGRNSYDYWEIMGKNSKKNYKEGDILDD